MWNNKSSRSTIPDYSDTVYNVDSEHDFQIPRFLEFGPCVGNGVYGDVFKATYHGFPVAVKVIKGSLKDETRREKILEELKIICKLRHPNVVYLMDHFVDHRGHLFIITEYCSRGNLKDNLPKIHSLTLRLKMAKDIICGMNWLHANSIIHRDLKPANILVSEDYVIKITDFGLSLRWNPGVVCRSFSGNIKYSPPEILRARENKDESIFHYCPETDVYAFGLLLWEMITLGIPFREVKSRKDAIQMVIDGYRPPVDESWPKLLKSLLASAWNKDPHKRPLFEEIQKKFDRVIINLLCRGSLARKIGSELWEDYPMRTITIKDFEKTFIRHSGVNRLTCKKGIDYMINLVSNTFEGVVSLERFGMMLKWFGSLKSGHEYLIRIEETLDKEWFHGFVNANQSASLLSSEFEENHIECYLFRFSVSSPGNFNLSYIQHDRSVVHRRITRQHGNYVLTNEPQNEFTSLIDLHDYCVNKGELMYKIPCRRASELEYLR